MYMVMEKGKLNTGSLAKATKEALKAALTRETVPKCPIHCDGLKKGLENFSEKFPKVYQEKYIEPFMEKLDFDGPITVEFYLYREGEDSDYAILAQPLLQRCSCLEQTATDAFQEIVSDLYDGFLSMEIREDIKAPDYSVVAPLVAWTPSWVRTEYGMQPTGPCTIPADMLNSAFNIKTGIVYLPIQYASLGLLFWATLSHETAGHDILHADIGLLDEMASKVKDALTGEKLDMLADYWSTRVDETASDIMGILNIGPAAGIALVGVFRALGAAYKESQGYKLSNIGLADDEHPAGILRAYLAASAIRNLEFGNAGEWAKYIDAEADRDLEEIRLNVAIDPATGRPDPGSGTVVSPEDARRSARIVAEVLVKGRMDCLEKHALGEIQNWKDKDEAIANELISNLTTLSPINDAYSKGIYAAHVVAAAVVASLSEDADMEILFKGMVSILRLMHDGNPVWSLPIYLENPGDLAARRSMRLSNILYCGCR